jgi:hypothetical protein
MRFDKSIWGRWVIRAFAALNFMFAAVGAYAVGEGAAPILARVHDSPATPYVREIYYSMTVIDLACLVMLTVAGIYLWGLNGRGLRICNFVFTIEIAWFLGTTAMGLTLAMSSGRWMLLGRSIEAASGIGSLGTTPQIVTAYPVLALVVLNLVRGSFRNHALQK